MAKLSWVDIESACSSDVESFQRRRDERGYRKSAKALSRPSTGPVIRSSPAGHPVKIWSNTLDTAAWRQAVDFADLPFVHPKGVALMPDVHPGKGVPVGCVLPTVKALVPAAVGVDIGCGMIAARLNISAADLPDNLRDLRKKIEASVPVDKIGRHRVVPQASLSAWETLASGHEWLAECHPRAALGASCPKHLGTLGSGNHFIEVCLDENQGVWVMIHSGSRGIGAAVGRYFMDEASRRVRENGERGPGGMGWFMEEDPLFASYVQAVSWAQQVAEVNRRLMLDAVVAALAETLLRPIFIQENVVSCHHNYVACESHFGEDVWITRKGAISARAGEMGIIPGAMGRESFIVRGLGNADAWCSCSHGAGRVLSRSAAKERYTVAELRQQTSGLECRKTRAFVDEIPAAYKPIKDVMAAQRDLVEIHARLRAVVCVKGE